MVTRILVPTDFSKPSDAALTYAMRLAAATGASLDVLHVVDNLFLRTILADPRDYEAAAFRELEDRVLASGGWRSVVLAVEPSEDPAEEIIGYARSHGIDLIVMGTHGRGRLAHLLLGSVAEKVARSADCPVLTMRDTPIRPKTERVRILVPTDFSPCSDNALACAKRLAAQVGGSIRLLHVVDHCAVGTSVGSELFVPEPPEMQAERMTDARLQLSNRVQWDSRSCVKMTSDLAYGPPGAMIAACTVDGGFDLLVMGTHGRSGLSRLFMGSIAESVIRTARCPVLTVRSDSAGMRVPTETVSAYVTVQGSGAA